MSFHPFVLDRVSHFLGVCLTDGDGMRSTYTKIWLENQPSEADMNDLTTRFQDQEELFARMFERFEQGYSHVKASLEAYLCEH